MYHFMQVIVQLVTEARAHIQKWRAFEMYTLYITVQVVGNTGSIMMIILS